MKGFVFLILVFVGALGSAAENIILPQAGTLASALGDKLLTVEELSIDGQINETDFNTLWCATYDGKLGPSRKPSAFVKLNWREC
ncbi:MAG: hypothetical protein K2G24_06045 [Muribaculaceae bacterium]|nr:hypothetical protein [Muribaculaceae bacterium]